MAKRLRLTVDGTELYADLLTKEAPLACIEMERAGRFRTVLFAANVCYGEMTFNTPVADYWGEQNVQAETEPGDVTFYNDWSSVCVFTRRMEQFGPGAKFAQVRGEDLPAFQRLAERAWHEQPITVEVEVVSDSAGEEPCVLPAPERLFPLPAPKTLEVRVLEDELEAIWLRRPDEIDRMVERNAQTGREFGVWAYAWGEAVTLADFLRVLLGMAYEREGSVRTLRAVAARELRFFSPIFRDSAHMAHVSELLEEAAGAYGEVVSFAEFYALTRAVQRYLVQLSFWLDMELPWDGVSALVHRAWNPGLPDPNLPGGVDGDAERDGKGNKGGGHKGKKGKGKSKGGGKGKGRKKGKGHKGKLRDHGKGKVE